MRGDLLEQVTELQLVEPLRHLMRQANAAGIQTNDPRVQVALLQALSQMLMVGALLSMHGSLDRCGDYLRDIARRKDGY